MFARRAAALIVDLVIVATVEAVTVGIAVAVATLGDAAAAVAFTAAITAIALLPLLYLTLFEGSPFGQTYGKHLLGIRVAGEDGERLGYGRAGARTLARAASLLPLGLGYLWALWDREGRAWHDHLARSWVLAVPAPRLGPVRFTRLSLGPVWRALRTPPGPAP